uniref:Uncharacterized protein n=1 Tax=viral metagenome TaxID=1070528 RepID=A0A6M3IJN1_9ZZZZ
MAKKKSDESVLFPDVRVGDIIVKPWTFGMLFELSEPLDRIITKVEDRGLDIEFEKGILSYVTMAKLFTIASSEALEIICKTLDKPDEEVKELGMEDGIKIALIIYNQNKESIVSSLKNAFSSPPKKESEEEEQS